MICLEDLDFCLPGERIAQHPICPRDAARLLLLERGKGSLAEMPFRALREHVAPPDLLVVNDTRVIPARLRGHKLSGGHAEALLLGRCENGCWMALLKVTGTARKGLGLRFGELRAEVESVDPEGVALLRFERLAGAALDALLEQIGETPLPPYIRRGIACPQDLEDYQTIFAQHAGAVAAPTAALHFTPELAAALPIAAITLHVGPGTFRPLPDRPLETHELAPERFEIPEKTARAIRTARQSGGRVIAVGTTVVRALETTGGESGCGSTSLFIRPGFRFRVVDSLITNFHLPRSSLLLLAMAFAGIEALRRAYTHAIAERFRFYSYGDAMWIR